MTLADSRPKSPQLDTIRAISPQALNGLRRDMLRFAALQLRDQEAAEDLVHEAIEAALRNASSFTGQSSLKTWVFAILRHRMIDHLRQSSRTVALSTLIGDDDETQDRLDAL